MILAVVISQLPMPDAQAEGTNTVTFSMNGGSFDGEYNGYSFTDQTPVLVIDDDRKIDTYPDDKYASYAGFETESGKWYTDRECIEEFDTDSVITKSVTLYKKWYYAENGFCLNPDKTVLYKYDGEQTLVQIPDTVEVIAPYAFDSLENVRGIELPDSISRICGNAFSGAAGGTGIIYIYDNGTEQSSELAKQLADSYEQLVYSSYLDAAKVEQIAGIDYNISSSAAAAAVNAEAEDEDAQEEAAEYTVEFVTGISQVEGETRTVPAHSTVSESVSVNGKQPAILTAGRYSLSIEDEKQVVSYVFQGWYKEASYLNEWDFANDTIESDTTIYAKWDSTVTKYYYVDFVADGAENVPEQLKIYEGELLNEPSETPSISGKTFLGWYTDEEDSETEYTAWGEAISADLTLYAQWETDAYTVTFSMNGGKYSGTYEGTEYSSVKSVKTKVAKGEAIDDEAYPEYEDDAVFKYSGYSTDSNWYTDKNCLSKHSSSKAVKKNLTLYKKWYATTSGFRMNPQKTVLYKYTGSDSSVEIPDTVTVIGDDAFTSVSAVTDIALSDALEEVEDDAFSGFESITSTVTLTAESDSAIAIAKELAEKYSCFVYEETSDTDTDTGTDSDDSTDSSEGSSVSIISSNNSGSITLGATASGSAGTVSSAQSSDSPAGTTASSSTCFALGVTASTTSAAAAAASTASATAVDATSSAAAAASTTSADAAATSTAAAAAATSTAAAAAATPTDAAAAAQTYTANADVSLSSDVVSDNKPETAESSTVTASTADAAAASTSAGTLHVKDSTPKTGDTVQYRTLLVCVLFSLGTLLVLTGNGKKKKAFPS